MASTGMLTKRVHVAGLQPDVSMDDLRGRFAIFGGISDVELIKDDFGQCRGFAYLNIHMTQQQWLKCLSTYQHSKWRGKSLNIEDAQPTYIERMLNSSEKSLPKRPKSSVKHARHYKLMDIVTDKTATNYPGWKIGRQNRAIYAMRIRKGRSIRIMDPTKSRTRTHRRFGDNSTVEPYPIERLSWSLRDKSDLPNEKLWPTSNDSQSMVDEDSSSSDSDLDETKERKKQFKTMSVEEQIAYDDIKNQNILKLFMDDDQCGSGTIHFQNDNITLNLFTGVDSGDEMNIERLRAQILPQQGNNKNNNTQMSTYHSDSESEPQDAGESKKTTSKSHSNQEKKHKDEDMNEETHEKTNNNEKRDTNRKTHSKDSSSDEEEEEEENDSSSDSSSSSSDSSSSEDEEKKDSVLLSSLFAQTVKNSSSETFSFLGDNSIVVLPQKKPKAIHQENNDVFWKANREGNRKLPADLGHLLRNEAPLFYPPNEQMADRSAMKELLDPANDTIPLFATKNTKEEIQSEWEEKRNSLTEEYKKRHKDAVKKKVKSNRGVQK